MLKRTTWIIIVVLLIVSVMSTVCFAGNTTTVGIEVTRGTVPHHDVTIIVQDEESAAIVGASVYVTFHSTTELVGMTDSSGKIVIPLIDGSYTARLSKVGYEDNFCDFTVAGAAVFPPTVVLKRNATLKQVDFEVKNDSGVAVENAIISIDGKGVYGTDANGKVSAWLKQGSHGYSVSHEAHDTYTDTFAVGSVGITTVPVTLLQKRYDVNFTVKDINNTAIPNAKISMAGQVVLTNASGRADILGLLPQIYPYTVIKDGYADIADSVKIINSTVIKEVV
ncbi:MAG: hypothetical protein RSD64_03145, partial [Christensenellaceae bacterium]